MVWVFSWALGVSQTKKKNPQKQMKIIWKNSTVTYLDRLQMLTLNNSSGWQVKILTKFWKGRERKKFSDDLKPINSFWQHAKFGGPGFLSKAFAANGLDS